MEKTIIVIIIIIIICCCCCCISSSAYLISSSNKNPSMTTLEKLNTTKPNTSASAQSPMQAQAPAQAQAQAQAPAQAQAQAPAQEPAPTQAPTAAPTAAPTKAPTPAPLVCNTNPQALLGNRSCSSWSWGDERTEQRYQMPNYSKTGTVAPGWDCWYEPTTQCVSKECLNSSNPTQGCPKRNQW